MEKFWMIYAEGGHVPNVMHQSYESAKRECERIIKKDAYTAMYILEAKECIRVKIEIEEIPIT